MRFSLLLILLVLPVVEIWLLIELANRYGWWLAAYLIVVAVLGWRLIQDEKQFMMGRMMQGMMQGNAPARALLSGAKNMLAGVLLLIPGVITDAVAVILLLLPSNNTPQPQSFGKKTRAANDDVIEGEYTRED